MVKGNLAILLTLLMGSGILLGMDNTVAVVPAATIAKATAYLEHNYKLYMALRTNDYPLFKKLLYNPLTDINYVVFDKNGEEQCFLWQVIRESYPDSDFAKALTEYEAAQKKAGKESPEIQLCKACYELNPLQIEILLDQPNLDVNYSKNGSPQPVRILIRALMAAFDRLDKCREEEIEQQKKKIENGTDALKRLLASGKVDLQNCKDFRGNNLLHITVPNPYVLQIILEALSAGKAKIDINARSTWDLGVPALSLAAACQPSSVMLLARHPGVDLQCGVLPAIHSRLDDEYKRDILYCLVEHGAEVSDEMAEQVIVNKMERNRLEGYVFTPDNYELVYTLLALGACPDRKLLLPYEELLASYAQTCPTLFYKPTVPCAEQLLFNLYCRGTSVLMSKDLSALSNPTAPPIGDATTYISRVGTQIDPNAIDPIGLGLTALHWAAARGNEPLVRELLALPNIDTSRTDFRGNTALHYASFIGRPNIVRLLLQHNGVSIVQTNKAGLTAMKMAKIRWSRFQGNTENLLLPSTNDFSLGMRNINECIAQIKLKTVFDELNKRRLALISVAHEKNKHVAPAIPKDVLRLIAQYLHLGDAPAAEAKNDAA